MNNQLKTIFFDLDNTLYDYDSVNEIAEDSLAKDASRILKINKEEFKQYYQLAKNEVKMPLRGTASSHNRVLYMQKVLEYTKKTVDPGIILDLYHSYWDTLVDAAKLVPYAKEVLSFIKEKGLNIGIVTNLTTYVQMRKVRELGITEYIDYIVTSEEAGADKPNPAPFLLAMSKFNCLASECLFVGDNPETDIIGAKNVGISTIHFSFGRHSKDAINSNYLPDYSIKSLVEIKDIIAILL